MQNIQIYKQLPYQLQVNMAGHGEVGMAHNSRLPVLSWVLFEVGENLKEFITHSSSHPKQ